MSRFALIALAFFLTASAGAADLPIGTWAANTDGTKCDLVIKEVTEGGTVKGTLAGAEFVGKWNGRSLTFAFDNVASYEGHLITEPAENGQTKYTLTGTFREKLPAMSARVPI